MRLKTVRVQNYRSIRDTGEFDIEEAKTILVGPNEAGKTAILQALQQINAPKGTKGFDSLRDYPRSLYNDISTGKVAAMRHGVILPPQLRLHHRKPSADDQLRGIKVPRYSLGPHYDLALAMKGKSGRYCHLAEVLLNLGIPAQMLRHKLWYQNPHSAADWACLEGHVAQDVVFTGMALASWLAAQGLAKVNPRIAIGQLAAMYAKSGRSQGLVSNRFHKLSARMLIGSQGLAA